MIARLGVLLALAVVLGSVANALSEILVVPVAGGTPVRIAANDPPACAHRASPGVSNSWPRWAPDVTAVGSRTYQWLAFSSRRGEQKNAQIYVSAVVVDESQQPPLITTTPALYLWSQSPDDSNHTPSWDPSKVSFQ